MEKNLEKKRKSSTKPGDIPKKGGSLFKSQESKPVKKPSAAEMKAQQDAQLLNMLSMVPLPVADLWKSTPITWFPLLRSTQAASILAA